MASPVSMYQDEMHRNVGFFATWLPGDPIELGDAGVFEGGRFRSLRSLAELGIRCEESIAQSRQDMQYTSTSYTKLSVGGSAAATGVASAEIAIDFSHAGAFVFHAAGLRVHRLANRSEIAARILDAYERGDWQKEWLVVEALHAAERATVIVSEDSSAGLVLNARASVALQAVSLADPKIGLSVASTRGRLVHVVGARNIRPLYSCLRLETPLLGSPNVRPVRGVASAEGAALERPGIGELLSS
jgi:hypothetical protein